MVRGSALAPKLEYAIFSHRMLTKKQKDAVIASFKTHENDTGSAAVQIALLTKEIDLLTGHLKTHKKDFSSRRGLIKKVSQRRRLLKFLQLDDEQQFENIIKRLKLRRPTKITAVDDDIRKEEESLITEEEAIVEVAAVDKKEEE